MFIAESVSEKFFFKSVNVCYKQERDRFVLFLRLLAACWPSASYPRDCIWSSARSQVKSTGRLFCSSALSPKRHKQTNIHNLKTSTMVSSGWCRVLWNPIDSWQVYGDAENARHELAAPICKGGNCEIWKCEKRDSMEHRVLHMSVHCRAGMHG